ncbi:hypothetical protein PINS_up007662 [Pythium insidiosum]|nr:hypothetical protein PINS_up007662 [Pythium insidiosum]
MLRGMAAARVDAGVQDLVVIGDSRIAIQECQEAIGCNQPHLQLLLNAFHEERGRFKSVQLIHVKREFNAAADYLTTKVLKAGTDCDITDPDKLDHLKLINQLPACIIKPAEDVGPAIVAQEPATTLVEVTRSRADAGSSTETGDTDNASHAGNSRSQGRSNEDPVDETEVVEEHPATPVRGPPAEAVHGLLSREIWQTCVVESIKKTGTWRM